MASLSRCSGRIVLTVGEPAACMAPWYSAVFMRHLLAVRDGAQVLGENAAERAKRLLPDRFRQRGPRAFVR